MEEFKPTKHDDKRDTDIYEHPSFGTIEISRWDSSDHVLFGSSIKHRHGVIIRINHAELHRGLHGDWIHSRNGIVEVLLSPSQFSDAITNLNSGSTPVTLQYVAGQNKIPEPPFQNKVAEFNNEFEESIKAITTKFNDVIKLANDTRAQKRLIKDIEMLKQHIESNIPFITESFSEQMAKTVTEAKGEVDAFIHTKIERAGIESLNAPQLPSLEPPHKLSVTFEESTNNIQ